MQLTLIKAGFLEASSRRPVDRAAFLAEFCPGDPELQACILKLVSLEDSLGDFLERPIPEQDWLKNQIAPTIPALGRRLGPYQLIREIGRGGMSVVFLATRSDDLYQRQVAIKVIDRFHAGGDIEQNIRRERQVLATLGHPNIACLYDAGVTDDGIAYLVMEHVPGIPIDAYCNHHALSTQSRLRLFMSVCDAVSFAHRNLIVHRDLKPSNVVVTEEGVPKLIDFGISKLLPQGGGTDTTRTGLLPMTPAYASPEQVAGRPITTASDVYSLGIMLYELLTGERPLKLEPSQPVEMARRLLEEVPRPPSKVNRQLSPDIDAILLMALRKEPERRYMSVEHLKADIDRFLSDRPVTARRDTLRYRTRKFLRRHWLAATAASIAGILAAAGLFSTLLYARRAEQRRAEGMALATSSLRYTYGLLRDHPNQTLEASKFALGRAVEYLRNLLRSAGPDENVEYQLYPLLCDLTDVDLNLGDKEGARPLIREAFALMERLARRPISDKTEHIMEGFFVLAHQNIRLGDGEGARQAAQAAFTLMRKLEGTHPQSEKIAHLLSNFHRDAAGLLWDLGDRAAAIQQGRQAVEVDRNVPFGQHPDPEKRVYDRANSNSLLAYYLSRVGDEAGSIQSRDVALRILRERMQTLGDDEARSNLWLGLHRAGLGSRWLRRPDALQLQRESLAVRKTLPGGDPQDLPRIQYGIGTALANARRFGEARRELEIALEEIRSAYNSAPTHSEFLLGIVLRDYSDVLAKLHRRREALQAAEEAVQHAKTASERDRLNMNNKQEYEAAQANQKRINALFK